MSPHSGFFHCIRCRRRLSHLSINFDDDYFKLDYDLDSVLEDISPENGRKPHSGITVIMSKSTSDTGSNQKPCSISSRIDNVDTINVKEGEYRQGRQQQSHSDLDIVCQNSPSVLSVTRSSVKHRLQRRESIFDTQVTTGARILRHRQTIDVWNRIKNGPLC